jgi:hypothetical protein
VWRRIRLFCTHDWLQVTVFNGAGFVWRELSTLIIIDETPPSSGSVSVVNRASRNSTSVAWINTLEKVEFALSLGCYNWSSLGFPREVVRASGAAIPQLGEWADLQSEVQQRRVQLFKVAKSGEQTLVRDLLFESLSTAECVPHPNVTNSSAYLRQVSCSNFTDARAKCLSLNFSLCEPSEALYGKWSIGHPVAEQGWTTWNRTGGADGVYLFLLNASAADSIPPPRSQFALCCNMPRVFWTHTPATFSAERAKLLCNQSSPIGATGSNITLINKRLCSEAELHTLVALYGLDASDPSQVPAKFWIRRDSNVGYITLAPSWKSRPAFPGESSIFPLCCADRALSPSGLTFLSATNLTLASKRSAQATSLVPQGVGDLAAHIVAVSEDESYLLRILVQNVGGLQATNVSAVFRIDPVAPHSYSGLQVSFPDATHSAETMHLGGSAVDGQYQNFAMATTTGVNITWHVSDWDSGLDTFALEAQLVGADATVAGVLSILNGSSSRVWLLPNLTAFSRDVVNGDVITFIGRATDVAGNVAVEARVVKVDFSDPAPHGFDPVPAVFHCKGETLVVSGAAGSTTNVHVELESCEFDAISRDKCMATLDRLEYEGLDPLQPAAQFAIMFPEDNGGLPGVNFTAISFRDISQYPTKAFVEVTFLCTVPSYVFSIGLCATSSRAEMSGALIASLAATTCPDLNGATLSTHLFSLESISLNGTALWSYAWAWPYPLAIATCDVRTHEDALPLGCLPTGPVFATVLSLMSAFGARHVAHPFQSRQSLVVADAWHPSGGLNNSVPCLLQAVHWGFSYAIVNASLLQLGYDISRGIPSQPKLALLHSRGNNTIWFPLGLLEEGGLPVIVDESFADLHLRLVGMSDPESGLLPTSHEVHYNFVFNSLPDYLPPGYYVRLNPEAFSRKELRTLPFTFPRKSYIPGSWYYLINELALSEDGGFLLDGPVDRAFASNGTETDVTHSKLLPIGGFNTSCETSDSQCFKREPVANINMAFNGSRDFDDLLDTHSNSSVGFARFLFENGTASSPTTPEDSFRLSVKGAAGGSNELIRWRRLYINSTGLVTLNITVQMQGHPCECVATSDPVFRDGNFCKARTSECPMGGCVAPGGSLSGCADQSVVVDDARALATEESELSLCNMELHADVSLHVSAKGLLSITHDLDVTKRLALTNDGVLDVLGRFRLGSRQLPHLPVNFTLPLGTLQVGSLILFPNNRLQWSASEPFASLRLSRLRSQEQLSRKCIDCIHTVEPPRCLVRNPNCSDSMGFSPVEKTPQQYWANCSQCVCQGGREACTTHRAPFGYAPAWCFIDAASRASGCVGSDGSFARFSNSAFQPWATCVPLCRCAEDSFCGEIRLGRTSLCRVLSSECTQADGSGPLLLDATHWTTCTPCQCAGGSALDGSCRLQAANDTQASCRVVDSGSTCTDSKGLSVASAQVANCVPCKCRAHCIDGKCEAESRNCVDIDGHPPVLQEVPSGFVPMISCTNSSCICDASDEVRGPTHAVDMSKNASLGTCAQHRGLNFSTCSVKSPYCVGLRGEAPSLASALGFNGSAVRFVSSCQEVPCECRPNKDGSHACYFDADLGGGSFCQSTDVGCTWEGAGTELVSGLAISACKRCRCMSFCSGSNECQVDPEDLDCVDYLGQRPKLRSDSTYTVNCKFCPCLPGQFLSALTTGAIVRTTTETTTIPTTTEGSCATLADDIHTCEPSVDEACELYPPLWSVDVSDWISWTEANASIVDATTPGNNHRVLCAPPCECDPAWVLSTDPSKVPCPVQSTSCAPLPLNSAVQSSKADSQTLNISFAACSFDTASCTLAAAGYDDVFPRLLVAEFDPRNASSLCLDMNGWLPRQLEGRSGYWGVCRWSSGPRTSCFDVSNRAWVGGIDCPHPCVNASTCPPCECAGECNALAPGMCVVKDNYCWDVNHNPSSLFATSPLSRPVYAQSCATCECVDDSLCFFNASLGLKTCSARQACLDPFFETVAKGGLMTCEPVPCLSDDEENFACLDKSCATAKSSAVSCAPRYCECEGNCIISAGEVSGVCPALGDLPCVQPPLASDLRRCSSLPSNFIFNSTTDICEAVLIPNATAASLAASVLVRVYSSVELESSTLTVGRLAALTVENRLTLNVSTIQLQMGASVRSDGWRMLNSTIEFRGKDNTSNINFVLHGGRQVALTWIRWPPPQLGLIDASATVLVGGSPFIYFWSGAFVQVYDSTKNSWGVREEFSVLDAACENGTPQQALLFVGSEYWLYDVVLRTFSAAHSLLSTSGLAGGLDPSWFPLDATIYEGLTQRVYFLKNQSYCYATWSEGALSNFLQPANNTLAQLAAGYPSNWTKLTSAGTLPNGNMFFIDGLEVVIAKSRKVLAPGVVSSFRSTSCQHCRCRVGSPGVPVCTPNLALHDGIPMCEVEPDLASVCVDERGKR